MQRLFVGEMIHNHAWLRVLGMGIDHKGGRDNHWRSLLFWTYPLSDVSGINHESSRYGDAIVVVIVVQNCNACGGLILEKRICKPKSIRHKNNQKRGYVLG